MRFVPPTPKTPTPSPGIAHECFKIWGKVPPDIFEGFRAKSSERLTSALRRGEYVGWLATDAAAPITIIGGAGIALRDVLPHPLVRSQGKVEIAEGRHAVIVNVFTEPNWRRRGVAAALLQRILDYAQEQHLDRLLLHASKQGRALYQRFGFVATNEMRFEGCKKIAQLMR